MSENSVPVECPLPGQVIQVNVKEGDRIQAGQPVVTLMSMKTEFKVESPEDGVVGEIKVKDGMEVSVGDILLYIKKS